MIFCTSDGEAWELARRYVNLGRFAGQARIFATANEARAWLDSLATDQAAGTKA